MRAWLRAWVGAGVGVRVGLGLGGLGSGGEEVHLKALHESPRVLERLDAHLMTEGAAAASVVDHLCLEGVPRMDGGHEHTDRGLVEGGGWRGEGGG